MFIQEGQVEKHVALEMEPIERYTAPLLPVPQSAASLTQE